MEKPTEHSSVFAAALLGAAAVASSSQNGVDEAFADELGTASAAPVDDRQVCFTFKTSACTECGACVNACRKYNGTPDGVASRRKVVLYTLASGVEVPVSISCQHCADPACVKVCPAQAIEKRADGIVVQHPDRCIGCKYCYTACPFGVPNYTSEHMDKCDFCIGNGVEPVTRPHCAQACPVKALDAGLHRDVFSRVEDPDSYRQVASSTGASLYLA
jgi:Fe-S-cluster-containing dehydrogenase component